MRKDRDKSTKVITKPVVVIDDRHFQGKSLIAVNDQGRSIWDPFFFTKYYFID